METLYTVVTLNGRAFMFEADKMEDYGEFYTFYLEDEEVAEFRKEAIAGYFISRYFEDEDE